MEVFIMAKSGAITGIYESLPKIVKVLLQIFLGYPISAVYRIVRFLETKNILTLVIGILCFFGIGFIFWIIDLITEITSNKITVLA